MFTGPHESLDTEHLNMAAPLYPCITLCRSTDYSTYNYVQTEAAHTVDSNIT